MQESKTRKTDGQRGKQRSARRRAGYERFAALSDAAKAAEIAEYEKPFNHIDAHPLSTRGTGDAPARPWEVSRHLRFSKYPLDSI